MPFGGNLHISKPLTNISVMYKPEGYIAQEVLKDIKVQKESDLYYVYTRDWTIPQTLRANGTPSNRITYSMSTSSYVLQEHALSDVITQRDRNNADHDIDATTVEILTENILRRLEKSAVDLLFTTGTWSQYTQHNTATAWKYNTTTSAPIQNVLSGTAVIIKNSGKRPNMMVLGQDTFDSLKENNNVYARIQYAERAILTVDLLASIFDVQKVVVGSAAYNEGKEGQTESITSLWGGHALLAYFDPSPGLKKVTAAGTLRNYEFGTPFKVKKWRDEEVDGDKVEVSTMYSCQAIATLCGYYFSSVTGS